jgi:N-acetylglucosamine-6-phosphate deacetylase
VDPDPDVATLWANSGLVRIVTLAPERPGADRVAKILSDAGVVVSLGHTEADFDTAREALGSTASLVTHLFNQMSGLSHREPGVVSAALLSDRPAIMIVDGLHIAVGALQVAWRMLGDERTILATDAMAALGLGPGTYPLGDGPITVGAEGPRTADGRLAGTVVTLPRAVRNLIDATSADLGQALLCATRNPANLLALHDRGSLSPGRRADIVVLDHDLNVVMTLVSGVRSASAG